MSPLYVSTAFAVVAVVAWLVWRKAARGSGRAAAPWGGGKVVFSNTIKGKELEELMKRVHANMKRESEIEPDATPDKPGFTERVATIIAVPTEDIGAVAREIGLANVVAANWDTGGRLGRSPMNRKVFVGPSRGWSFIVGADRDPCGDAGIDPTLALLRRLGAAFGDAIFSHTCTTTMSFGWARAPQGNLARAYYFDWDKGALVWNEGPLTEEEIVGGWKFGASGAKGEVDRETMEENPDCCRFEEAAEDIAVRWGQPADAFDFRSPVRSVGVVGDWEPI